MMLYICVGLRVGVGAGVRADVVPVGTAALPVRRVAVGGAAAVLVQVALMGIVVVVAVVVVIGGNDECAKSGERVGVASCTCARHGEISRKMQRLSAAEPRNADDETKPEFVSVARLGS